MRPMTPQDRLSALAKRCHFRSMEARIAGDADAWLAWSNRSDGFLLPAQSGGFR